MGRLTEKQGKALVSLARQAITSYLAEGKAIKAPEGLPREKQGVFCTLKTKLDVLRGCIGLPYPTKPLADAVIDAAVSSAVGDPRFKPVELDELGDIKIELTVLTVPEELTCPKNDIPKNITIGKHGLIIEQGRTGGLLLPQVAVENGPWKPIEFLEAVCWKAGLPPHAWMDPKTKLYTFEGQIFEE